MTRHTCAREQPSVRASCARSRLRFRGTASYGTASMITSHACAQGVLRASDVHG
eukprot:CAMPEP_0195078888 /NCGR_PEP_ID=MMETSP0448-20130528/20963_1 /TAXON_ID=66468 /ORGANISM="Heterocapsa triquestra, Strain CCMP 448" /LENGTH=53 /DNA_ID=CAMNT_0040111663 /DNA_START=97 /DNA_END=254 /DNA_ORIENTATION=+